MKLFNALSRHLRLQLCIFISVIALVLPAHATSHNHSITLKQATEIAQAAFPGDIIRSEVSHKDGRSIYVVRLLKDGRVKEILVDSSNGKIITPDT